MREELDPWNIDIVDITSKYLETIRSMRRVDLHVPANLILAAAILVRIKSEILTFEETVEETVDVVEDGLPDITTSAEVENASEFTLFLRPKLPKKRKVTLQELLSAVEEAFEFEKKRAERRSRVAVSIKDLPMNIDVEKVDVEKVLNDVYSRILQNMDDYKLVRFSEIVKADVKDITRVLMAILYLVMNGILDVEQEEVFGEILVRVIKEDASIKELEITI
ncbi:MAG: segregation/condensation protein A [Candidatus Asgardarchaeia archaeon]